MAAKAWVGMVRRRECVGRAERAAKTVATAVDIDCGPAWWWCARSGEPSLLPCAERMRGSAEEDELEEGLEALRRTARANSSS